MIVEKIRVFIVETSPEILAQVAVILVASWLALRFSRLLVRGLVHLALDREAKEGTAQELTAVEIAKRKETLGGLGTRVLRLIILVITFLTVLGTLRIDIGPALAGLGVAAVALGIGGQSVVRDYLSGAFVLIENQYSIGDVVRLAGVTGTVEDFTLRRTTLRDLDGTVHTVPNGAVTVASNLTRVWARINIDILVAFGTDLERATAVVDAVGRQMAGEADWQRRVLEAPRVERVEQIGEYGITLKVLGSVRAADRWSASGDLRKRILTAFAEAGIEIPRPQRIVLAARDAPRGTAGDAGAIALDDELARDTD